MASPRPSRVLFPVFAQKNDIDTTKVNWVNVTPNLRQASLLQGQADAAAGHVFTVLLGLRALGVKDDEIQLMPYANYGVDLLGNSIMTKPQWATSHKKEMQDFISCAITGIKASIAEPDAAIASLKKFNSMADDKIEIEGLKFSSTFAILTPHVKEEGLSQINPERLKTMLPQIAKAIDIPVPAMEEIWTDAYLPPKAERMFTP
jgi:NitT/TauT family transport system substrate-binding protein